MGLCKAPGCPSRAHARGLCNTHYNRVRHHGSFDKQNGRINHELDAMFERLVGNEEKAENCKEAKDHLICPRCSQKISRRTGLAIDDTSRKRRKN